MFVATTLKATGIIGAACSVLAAALVWLVVTDPVQVASAVNSGDVTSVVGLLTTAMLDALRAIARYL